MYKRLGIVTQNCNPSIKESEAGGSHGLYKILFQPKRENKTKQNQSLLKWGKECHCVAQAGLKPAILLYRPSRFWDDRNVLPHPVYSTGLGTFQHFLLAVTL